MTEKKEENDRRDKSKRGNGQKLSKKGQTEKMLGALVLHLLKNGKMLPHFPCS